MGGGRKNLKRAVDEEIITLQQGHSIMQVVDLRGSNLIEVPCPLNTGPHLTMKLENLF